MSEDDLSKPLRPEESQARTRFGMSLVNISAAALIFAGLGLLTWIGLQNDRLGGQPFAVVSLDLSATRDSQKLYGENVPVNIRESISPEEKDQIESVDGDASPNVSAIQRGGDIAIGSDNENRDFGQIDALPNSAGQPIIHGSNQNVRLSNAPNRNLIEQTRAGSLPQVGPQGQRASVIYARPSGINPTNSDDPKIAILVTGLGISTSSTSEAIQRLPEPVTLAFAPYGNDLQRWIGKARRNGHEVMLQIPMEPFDFPDNDPGPHTLLTSVDAAENLNRLRWLMSRFTGYIGITNYMGAKFTGTRSAFEPVLREIANRGLVYLEDGSSPRSTQEQIAQAVSLQSESADILIDVRQTQENIDEALLQLESLALQRGQAIGVASALPLTIERIAEWAAGLEEKGIVLIPVSAVYVRHEQS